MESVKNNNNLMYLSKGEEILRKLVRKRYRSAKYNYRPQWLTNPTTGRKLELDIFICEKQLAFEYQGYMHRGYSQSFKDEIKRILCRHAGIKLYTVYPMDLRPFARKVLDVDKLQYPELFEEVKAYMDKAEKLDKNVRIKSDQKGISDARKFVGKSSKWFTLWKNVQQRKALLT